jgi:hypothetical protein
LFTLPGFVFTPALRFSPEDQWLAGAVSGEQLGIWKVGAGRDTTPSTKPVHPI